MASLRDEIGDFVGIPNSFMEDRRQTAESRVVFMVLRYHTHKKTKRAFPGYETIMDESGLSRQKTAAGIKVLVETGWLVKHKQFAKVTEYELRYPATSVSSTEELREEAPIVPPANAVSSTEEQPPLSITEQEGSTKIDIAPATSRKSKPYPKRRTWPRAISLFFGVTNLAPMQQLWPEIERVLGDNPDPGRLRKCYVEWLRRGYRENALGWLEWYEYSVIPPQRGDNGRRNQNQAHAVNQSGLNPDNGAPRKKLFKERPHD